MGARRPCVRWAETRRGKRRARAPIVKMAMEPHHGTSRRAWIAPSAETVSPAGLRPVRPREARSAGGVTVAEADTTVSDRVETTVSFGGEIRPG